MLEGLLDLVWGKRQRPHLGVHEGAWEDVWVGLEGGGGGLGGLLANLRGSGEFHCCCGGLCVLPGNLRFGCCFFFGLSGRFRFDWFDSRFYSRFYSFFNRFDRLCIFCRPGHRWIWFPRGFGVLRFGWLLRFGGSVSFFRRPSELLLRRQGAYTASAHQPQHCYFLLLGFIGVWGGVGQLLCSSGRWGG